MVDSDKKGISIPPTMIKLQITIIAMLFVPLLGIGQNEEPIATKKELRKNRPTYSGISLVGLGIGSFRDFATSPLIYSGPSLSSSRFQISMDKQRETEWGSTLAVGLFGSNFNNHTSSSIVLSPAIYYSELYELEKLRGDKLNVKVGGLLNVTSNLRFNQGLLNNSVAIEVNPTLFGSIKGTLNVSRKSERTKKFLFFNYKLDKRKKSLALRWNTGLINSSYRNGYAYVGQSAPLNDLNVFDGYQFKVFSGFRVSSSLDYTLYSRKTTNAVQISYIWDAYKTGGGFDKFEMAQHAIRLTLLFNTK